MLWTLELESTRSPFMSDVDLWLLSYLNYDEHQREKVKQDFARSLLGKPVTKAAVSETAIRFFELQAFTAGRQVEPYEFIRSTLRIDGDRNIITLGLDFDKLPFTYQGLLLG